VKPLPIEVEASYPAIRILGTHIPLHLLDNLPVVQQLRLVKMVYRVYVHHRRHLVDVVEPSSLLVDTPFEQPSSLVAARKGYSLLGIPAGR
jgi:hypothetical protein